MADNSPEMPPSEWLTYSAAAERLGLSPSSIAFRAGRWPIRKRSATGEVEIKVPGTLLAVHAVEGGAAGDQELRSRVAEAVSRVHTARGRSQERTLAKIATALRQNWWRFGR
jgi:hypothetical protein